MAAATAACAGWDGDGAHHACGSPHLEPDHSGRCIRCRNLHRRATGPARDPFPSINELHLPGGEAMPTNPPNGTARAAMPADQRGDPDFQLYTGSQMVRRIGAAITLRVDGRLSLNALAWEALGRPEAVLLYFAPGARTIGLKPAAPPVEHARPLGSEGSDKRRTVGVRALLLHHGIDDARAGQYQLQRFGAIWGIALGTGAPLVRLADVQPPRERRA